MKKLLLICFLLLLISGNQFTVLRQAQSAKLNSRHKSLIEDSSSTQFAMKNSMQTNSAKSVSQQRLEAMKGSFTINQIVEEVNGVTTITNVGMLTFSYTPFENGNYFFNMTIINPSTNQMGWGIQNLFIPGMNYTTYPQSISVNFPLDIIGVEPGEFLDLVNYYYEVMANPMTYAPTGNPGEADVIPLLQDVSNGRVNTYTPETSPFDWYPEFWQDIQPKDEVYISCNPDDPKSMPNIDLNKKTYDGDKGGCGPAAAANSLSWLKKTHPEINFPTDLRNTFNQLSSLMNRKGKDGVEDNAFIRAKVDFAEMYNLPIKVKYQDNQSDGPILSSTGQTQAECMDASIGSFPTKEFLVNEAKDGEDIEIGYTYSSGSGHFVTLNGTVTYGSDTYIYCKSDGNQEEAGGTHNLYSRVAIENDKIKLPGHSNATVDIIVSESYDPDFTPPSTEVKFGRYCQMVRRLIPPGHKLIITYPDDAKSSYSTTIWEYSEIHREWWSKKTVWNFCGEKTFDLVNYSSNPNVFIIHNDDDAYGTTPNQIGKENISESYTINISHAIPADSGDVTSPCNESEYAGFSMGWDDDSEEEFSDSTDATVNFTVEIGCLLSDLPQSMNPNGTTRLNVNYSIPEINKYWSDLEFKLGIVSVETPGTVTLSFSNSPVPQTIEITNDTRDISIPIGGVQNAGSFSFSISTVGTNTAFTIDNIGIPTNVPMFPSSVEDNEVKPDQFQLMQNYPNPFNPTTIIKYQVMSSEKVNIKVYDMLGREVAILVDEVKEAGTYQVEFNANELSSGVYFYQMRAGSFYDIKKCLVLK
ncbi:MAG: T9SS type A sorting domain-containing protein [bacterium]